MTISTDSAPARSDEATTVALVTLGCARNEVDSEELAGRLEAGGFRLVADPTDAETIVVNTCGFVEAAKKDSVDTLLEAADLKDDGITRAVVAVGDAKNLERTVALGELLMDPRRTFPGVGGGHG